MEIALNNAAAVMNAVSGTQVAVRTEAKPIAWQGIQGCKNFSSPVTIKELSVSFHYGRYAVGRHNPYT